ncbi:MAG TPA: response regulator transcription factor [Rubrobacteraceae bacterium]|nr:response regulator transcription factor [Rubrobacteraceae bacterium]
MEGEEQTSARTGPAQVLVADDHDLVRDGYQRMLDREPDLEVVGEASNGQEAIELCRKLRPDLVLMDVRMPEMDGIEATRKIKGEFPTTSVLVVTTYENTDYLFEAVQAGAAGYVLKDAPKRQLLGAIRRTLNGESPLNQELAMQLISRFSRRSREPAPQPDAPKHQDASVTPPREVLTPRELEVLQLLARGKTNLQIAQELVISRLTAKTHVERIIRKFGVSDRTQAVLRAFELGLVTLTTKE